jgi:hypothetical protein
MASFLAGDFLIVQRRQGSGKERRSPSDPGTGMLNSRASGVEPVARRMG